MLRQRRLCSLILFFSLVLSFKIKADEYDLALQFIQQKDCQNAIPILKSSLQNPPIERQKDILLSLSLCADETLDLQLKKEVELKLLTLDPSNVSFQLKYIETLFYLSSYKEVLNFAEYRNRMFSDTQFWLSIGRTYYELSDYERSLLALKKYLARTKDNKAEAYYWMGKNKMEMEEYGDAIKDFESALEQQNQTKNWIRENSLELIKVAESKNKSYKSRLKLAYGYDNNILRDNNKSADSTAMIDFYQDYYFIRKKKTQLNLGADLSYQGYNKNTDFQYASGNIRLDYYHVLADYMSHGFSLSVGKILSNFKNDQNYTFSSYYLTYAVSKKLELQPSLIYFANLNNNPVKQISFSLSAYYYLDSDYMWLSPFYRKSSSPDPVFDNTGITPYIAQYSSTTNYAQQGMIIGYQKALSDLFSASAQYSYAVTQFEKYDLTPYPAANVKDSDARKDDQQTVKLALQYRQTPTVRWSLTTSSIFNKSKGFQGFATSTSAEFPDLNANYDQNMTSLGVTLDWP